MLLCILNKIHLLQILSDVVCYTAMRCLWVIPSSGPTAPLDVPIQIQGFTGRNAATDRKSHRPGESKRGPIDGTASVRRGAQLGVIDVAMSDRDADLERAEAMIAGWKEVMPTFRRDFNGEQRPCAMEAMLEYYNSQ